VNVPAAAVLAVLGLPTATSLALCLLAARQATATRLVSAGSVVAQLVLALALMLHLRAGAPIVVSLGAGAVLVIDRLSAWLLVASTASAACASAAGLALLVQRREQLLLQLQLLFVAGGLLAGDLVALWACIAASLALVCLAPLCTRGRRAAPRRLAAAGMACGLLGTLAVSAICAATGVASLATLAVIAPAVPAAAATSLQIAALVLLALLILPAAGLPLLLWSPRGEATAPLTLLAMTGTQVALVVYAILRLYTLVFPCFAEGPCSTAGLVLPAGLALVMAGGVGALRAAEASQRHGTAASLLVLVAGLALVSAGDFRVSGLATAIFYLMHAALTAVALILAVVLAGPATGDAGTASRSVPFAIAAAAAIGLPPFPGCIALLGLLLASAPDALAVWTLVPSSMLLALVATLRLAPGVAAAGSGPASRRARAAFGGAVAMLALLSLLARPAFDYATGAARQLLDRAGYVAAVRAALGD